MVIEINDIVVVIDSESVPTHFYGHYGKVTDVIGNKICVEFVKRIGSSGSLVHTAYPSDLKKVGVAYSYGGQ